MVMAFEGRSLEAMRTTAIKILWRFRRKLGDGTIFQFQMEWLPRLSDSSLLRLKTRQKAT